MTLTWTANVPSAVCYTDVCYVTRKNVGGDIEAPCLPGRRTTHMIHYQVQVMLVGQGVQY